MLADVAIVCPKCGSHVELTAAALLQSEGLGVSCLCADCQHEWICRRSGDGCGSSPSTVDSFAATANQPQRSIRRIVVRLVNVDPATRCSIERSMKREGVSTAVYDSADMFLGRANLIEPGCTVVGIRRGHRDAFLVLGELRRMRCHIPVLIVNEDGDVQSAIEGIRGGAFDVLVKPYSESDLTAILWKAIRWDLQQNPPQREQQESTSRDEHFRYKAHGQSRKTAGAVMGSSRMTLAET